MLLCGRGAQNEGMQPEDEDDDDEDGRDTEGFVTRGNLRFYDGENRRRLVERDTVEQTSADETTCQRSFVRLWQLRAWVAVSRLRCWAEPRMWKDTVHERVGVNMNANQSLL